MKKIKIVKNAYSILMLCLIVVGGVFLFFSAVALDIMCKIMGVFLIVYGLVKIIGYFSKDLFQLAYQFDCGLGFLSIVLGIIMLCRTDWIMETLSVVMGGFIAVDAVFRIQTAIEAKKFGLEKWWLILIMSFIVAVLGVLLLIFPHQATRLLMSLIGLNLILDGLMNLFIVQSSVQTIRM